MPVQQHDIDNVIQFWFGGSSEKDRLKLWFGGGSAVDDEIREKFGPLILRAEAGTLDDWQTTALGCLALIIVTDQFPLNVYRKTARAFDIGEQAVDVCKHGLAQSFDRALSIAERSFFYLPLEHSEGLANQDLSVKLFQQLHEDADIEQKSMTEKALEYAIEHRETIRQFGRYPYRNEVLGRESTSAEVAYLGDNPKRYGQ